MKKYIRSCDKCGKEITGFVKVSFVQLPSYRTIKSTNYDYCFECWNNILNPEKQKDKPKQEIKI